MSRYVERFGLLNLDKGTDKLAHRLRHLFSQGRLIAISETLSTRLSYFASLEPATRALNAPGAASQVTGPDFIPMIDRVDECLAYLQSHVRSSLLL